MNTQRAKPLGCLLVAGLALSGCYTATPSSEPEDAGPVLPGEVDGGAPRLYDYSWLLSLGVDLPDPRDGGSAPPEPGWGSGTIVDAGGDHACALTPQGRIFCWGLNLHGQVGVAPDGNGTCSGPNAVPCQQDTPIEVAAPGAARWTSISVGHTHTCALADDGVGYCWGSNSAGELGNGTHALSHDTATPTPVAVAFDRPFTAIAAGEYHTCGIADGQMYCWGANDDFELGAPATETCLYGFCARTPQRVGGRDDWHALSAGGQITCGIRAGALHCWGRSAFDQRGLECTDASDCAPREPLPVGTDSDWASVTTWASRTCALKQDASLWCWGSDELFRGRNEVPTRTALAGESVISVATGEDHTCAVLQGGALYCWGFDYSGEVGDGPGSPNDCDGFGCAESPVRIGDDYHQVSLGYSLSCGTTRSGAVTCWGSNRYGQVGASTTETCDPGSGQLEPCATAPTVLPPALD